jgi:GDP-4-dehydro-6-deoxy-D-mannose reductase
MLRILVTGANGFVGQHLVKELHENNIRVVGVGGPDLDSIKSPYIDDYYTIDLNNPVEVQTLDFKNVDGVIHLAGMADVGASFDKPLEYINTNVGIEINLYESAKSQAARPRFLIVSSGTLYDPSALLPFNEASSVKPNSPYSVSKLGQEQMAQYYQTRGFESVIARPFNHIGPGQGLGFLIPDLVKQVVDVEKGLADKVLVGNLDAERDYTDVRDIVRAYRLLLTTGKSGEIYNICSGTSISGNDILKTIVSISTVNPTIEQDSARIRPADTPKIFGNYHKLFEDTGWIPAIKIQDTLRDVVADWRSRS